MKPRFRPLLLALLALLAPLAPARAQTTVKPVVLQGFWWDYANGNFRHRWADYLVELAPRLKSLGIDAVWIPPISKNNNGTNSVGYAPFDHYDLGDKFQKGTTGTRVGTKDEVLRLIAVLHANGIDVIQDVVLNHMDGAGGANGTGGQDPAGLSPSANGGFKNFRNASFATPVPEGPDNAAAYGLRSGRWPKNAPNFHAHAGHNTITGDLAVPMFGPDFCFGDDGGADGFGPSSNTAHNPPQGPGYSRTQARNWLVWMKKQTGIDGIRWDAVKNYGYAPQQDWLFNLKYLAGFASGGETMHSVGEYVGGGADLDAYTTAVNGRNGGTDFAMGTFDFGLRGGIYGLVAGGGNYDLGQLPGTQQAQRVAFYGASNTFVHRTAPWVNSHDSFRPRLGPTGLYVGWNTAQELVPHIEPADPRLSPAYAVALAVDGSPYVFIEDLFDLVNGRRFTHLPADAAALPVRPDIANLIWCHQRLNFKAGAYAVRFQSPDHLVIERGGRALIGINDQFSTWQNSTVASSFAPGTVLKDYSGANGTATVTVGPGGRVAINTPPCNGTALLGRRGYSVWAPVGQDGNPYTPPRAVRTVQEWEMADDLGDRNCRSLNQGGALPAASTAWRTVGRVFAQGGTPVQCDVFPGRTTGTDALTLSVFDADGTLLTTRTGAGTLTGTLTPSADGWLTLKLRNATATQAGQGAFVKLTYQAPPAVATRAPANSPAPRRAVWNAAAGTPDALDCRNYENGLLPNGNLDWLIPAAALPAPVVPAGAFMAAANLTVEAGASLTVARTATVQLFGNLVADGPVTGGGTWRFTGLRRSPQRIGGATPLSLARVVIANDSANVALAAPLTITDTLALVRGRLALGPFNLTVGPVVEGGSAESYLLTDGPPAAGGACFRTATAPGPVLYPVGTAGGYAPLTYTHQSAFGSPLAGVRVVDGVLANATSGPAFGPSARFANHTWLLATGPAPNCCGPGTVALAWNAAAENPAFDRSQSALFSFDPGFNPGWTRRTAAPVPATGAAPGPYEAAFAGIVPGYLALAVGNFTALPTRAAAAPALLTVFPNPTAGTVQLTPAAAGPNGPAAQPLALRLTNALGQTLLAAAPAPLPAAQARLNAALATAAPGVYVLTVQAANGTTQHLRLVRE